MKRFISVLLALTLLLFSFSLMLLAAADRLHALDIYEGLTARDDDLYGYLQRLHCASPSMPKDSIDVFAYENGVRTGEEGCDALQE